MPLELIHPIVFQPKQLGVDKCAAGAQALNFKAELLALAAEEGDLFCDCGHHVTVKRTTPLLWMSTVKELPLVICTVPPAPPESVAAALGQTLLGQRVGAVDRVGPLDRGPHHAVDRAALDTLERANGAKAGKIREKFVRVADMLAALPPK